MTASTKAGSSPVRSASRVISSQNLGDAEQGRGTFGSFGSLLAGRVHVPRTMNDANVTTRHFVTKTMGRRLFSTVSATVGRHGSMKPSGRRAGAEERQSIGLASNELN